MKIFLLFLTMLFSNAFAAELLQVNLNKNTLQISIEGSEAYQVGDVLSLEKVDCYSGDLSNKSKSIHFGKRYSRHLYLFLNKDNDVYGIRDDGSVEKESGTGWESLEEFKYNLEVCS